MLALALAVALWCPPGALAAFADGPQSVAVSQGGGLAAASVATREADLGYDIAWYESDPESPEFLIQNARELRGLSALVNGTAQGDAGELLAPVDFAGATVYLDADVDLSAGIAAGGDISFIPIGTFGQGFAGAFDGQGHTVSNLRIVDVPEYAGLFGYTAAGSIVKNLNVSNGSAVLAGDESGETAVAVRVASDSAYVGKVGSLVGMADGELLNCASDGMVRVSSAAQATLARPYSVQNVGGLVGYARADVTGCTYTGSVNVQVATDALSANSSSDSLRVADSFGGLVGRFGDPGRHGTISDSCNLGDVVVQTAGTGAVDRFGTVTYAVAFFVGGIAGYSNGSVIGCHNGAYNTDTREVTGKVFTGGYAEDGTLLNNRGAEQVGGIVGSLRGESDDPDKYNDGDPDDPMVVSDCYNEAQITGLNATGGIVGQTGVYCTVTRCYNGTISDLSDWQRNQVAGKVVTTRWNKPLSGGVVGETRSGIVSYCANYAEVRNVQTGYYMAGIAGCIFTSDDYPNVTGEIYACFNSGGIYTINTAKGVEYREAGICGDNEGYVHDCIVMEGSVPYHDDQAIGNMDWGAYSNLHVVSPSDLATSQGAALLNAVASRAQDWSVYWFVNGQGYPVLNTWAEGGTRTLTAAELASVEQVSPAPYVGAGGAALPTLKVTLADGTVLVQDADFRVIPQPGAYEMSADPVYSAGIQGIGMYAGTVPGCARYGISSADLAMASVLVSPMKYRFGKVVFPESVTVTIAGSAIDPAEYDYVIYGSQTSAESASSPTAKAFAAYDSCGYISFDANGAVKQPVSQLEGGPAAINELDSDWWLYDRNHVLISDSAGNTYYESGSPYANTSCVNMKSGTPAGYVVKVEPSSGSTALSGNAIGYYVIEPVDLYRECAFHSATFGQGDAAIEWSWDPATASFFRDAADGVRTFGAETSFTGQTIQPSAKVSCGDYELVEGKDYRIICGDPNPSEAGEDTGEETPNRNVTGAEGAARAAVTIYPANTQNLSNYVIAYFDIAPARFEDCQVSLAREEWAYTGSEVRPDVKVSLGDVELVEGVDYEIEFADNVQRGQAAYSVKPLANLQGGSLEPVVGTFSIVDGQDIGELSLDAIPDVQFNWNYDVHPKLVFRNGAGDVVSLVEGEDYDVSYSTSKITKWPATDSAVESSTSPCEVTVTGKAGYTGSLSGSFHIVPYNATLNATNQLRALVQDLPYGTWGAPSAGTATRADGVKVPSDAIANVGSAYPVAAVLAYPVVDWAAYEAGDTDSCYGQPIPLTTTNNNDNGGLVNRFPARYFDALGVEVNGNGGVYANGDGSILAEPALAQPGPMKARVYLRTGTGGAKGGASGYLECTFVYMAPADISTVGWSVEGGACTYDGQVKEPVVGTTKGSGIALAEGVDYSIEYSDNTNAGLARYTVRGIGGSYFTGTYSGTFSIMPADLGAAEGVHVASVADQVVADAQVLASQGARPEVEVTRNGVALTKDVDYTVTYQNNHMYGDQASVRISGMGNYAGVVSRSFNIVAGTPVSGGDGSDSSGADSDGGSASTGSGSDTGSGSGAGAGTGSGSGATGGAGDSSKSQGGETGSGSTAGGTQQAGGAGSAASGSKGTSASQVSSAAAVLAAGSQTASKGGSTSSSTASSQKTTTTAQTTAKAKTTKTTKTTKKVKKAQPMTAKAKKAKVVLKRKTLKKKSVAITKPVKVAKAKGKVTYKNVSAKKLVKKWKVNAKSGKIVVPKGTKKGTYVVKLRVMAAGNTSYKSASKTVKFKVVVK